MSSVTIIAAIVILLFILICGAFISQTMREKREQRHRFLVALRAKSNKFKAILSICPKDFLSRDLKILALRKLIESCEGLSKVEPNEPNHLNDVQIYSAELNDTQRQAPQDEPISIDNPALLPQLKACLDELFQFVVNMESKHTLPRNQADSLKAQIKLLVITLSVNKNEMQGQTAYDSDQQKIALHYFSLTLQIILKDAKGSILEKKVPALKERIQEIKTFLRQEAQNNNINNKASEPDKPSSNSDKEWEEYEDENNGWKKKNIYD